METERVRATNYAGRTAVITRATLRDTEKEYAIIRELIMHNDFIPEDLRQRLIGLYTFKTIEPAECPKKTEQDEEKML